MEVIKVHPSAQPILVVTPEEREALQEVAAKITKAFVVIKEVFQKMVEALRPLLEFMRHPTPIRIYPTANPIEVPFYRAIELGYFRE